MSSHAVYLRSRRKSRFIYFLLICLIAVAALYAFLQSSFFMIREIRVEGNLRLESSEIIGLARINGGSNLWSVDERAVAQQLGSNPLIAGVEVLRFPPGKLVLSLTERFPVALISENQGFVEVDGQGVALRKVDKLTTVSLPIITGITVGQEIKLGSAIEADNLDAGLNLAKAVPSKLGERIAEINVMSPEQNRLYTNEGMEIRLGALDRLEDKFSVISEVLNGKIIRDAEYIDVSYPGRPVVRYKQANVDIKGGS